LILKEIKMQVIREFREIDSDEIVIKIPYSFKEKKVEIIVLPLDAETIVKKIPSPKKLPLTTYKCYGKKKDFTRSDAYRKKGKKRGQAKTPFPCLRRPTF